MKINNIFVVNVLATWLLTMSGMCLAGWLSPSRTVYPIVLVACLVPAGLFMKFRLPTSWYRFGSGIAVLSGIGILLAVLRKLEFGSDYTPMIVIGIITFAGPFMNKKEI